ncbi:hypothetical protein Ddc_13531 [Ditylenchus destructor]|nr:hypothetical protein Ddc_13531 [Ditylenchus destructor]
MILSRSGLESLVTDSNEDNSTLFSADDTSVLSADNDHTTVYCAGADDTTVFSACVDLHDEHWPVFQHFVRLLSDPFILIGQLHLTPLEYTVNLLAGAIYQDRDHTQCKRSTFNLEAPNYIGLIKNRMCCIKPRINDDTNLVSVAVNTHPKRLQCEELLLLSGCITPRTTNHVNTKKLIDWIKNNVLCKRFRIWHRMCPIERDHYDEGMFDFIVNGAQCTSKFTIRYYDLSGAIVNVVQKFMDFKSCDKCLFVQSIKNKQVPEDQTARVLKLKYAKFIVKEEKYVHRTAQVYEFVNGDIKKKMLLTVQVFDVDFNAYKLESSFLLTIENL